MSNAEATQNVAWNVGPNGLRRASEWRAPEVNDEALVVERPTHPGPFSRANDAAGLGKHNFVAWLIHDARIASFECSSITV